MLFSQPTMWERYRWYVVGAVAVIATQAVLIFALLFQRRRRNLAELAKEAQAEVQHKRAELEHVARVATLGELTATVVHEIAQPLAAILANSSAGINYLDAPEPNLREAHAALSDIRADTERSAEVIRRLRDMLKRDTPGFTSLDLNQLIRDVNRIVHGDAVAHRVTVDLDLSPGVLPVKADHVQLQQVMLNLMLNAFSAMGDAQLNARGA